MYHVTTALFGGGLQHHGDSVRGESVLLQPGEFLNHENIFLVPDYSIVGLDGLQFDTYSILYPNTFANEDAARLFEKIFSMACLHLHYQ